jgi:ribose/xylose/arabinose/galactoside ABC-type transport system permease subunit
MNGILVGALAGLAATVPMSLAMKLMHERLPEHEQYPLPPRAVTMEVAEQAGVRERMDEGERQAATWAGHFGYGATCGALYGALAARRDVPPLAAGVGFGLAVWAGSYLGWLPAAGILRPATEHPPRRNALMIAAHVVWGATTGLVVAGLSDGRENE